MENRDQNSSGFIDLEPRIMGFFQKNWQYVRAALLALVGLYLIWQVREILFSLILFSLGLGCLGAAAYSLGLTRVQRIWVFVYNSFR